jgi:hypothetical protein
MAKPIIYLRGIEELEKNCNQLIKDVTEGTKEILHKEALFVKGKIKEEIAAQFKVKTGKLKSAPYATVYPETTSWPAHAFVGVRPKRAPHAHLLTGGHGGPHPAKAYPFVTQAWDKCQWQVLEHIEGGLKNAIEGKVIGIVGKEGGAGSHQGVSEGPV